MYEYTCSYWPPPEELAGPAEELGVASEEVLGTTDDAEFVAGTIVFSEVGIDVAVGGTNGADIDSLRTARLMGTSTWPKSGKVLDVTILLGCETGCL
jgi:hypothetical protein